MESLPDILETDRLVLRPVRPSDVPALVDLWSDPQVTRFMGGPREGQMLVNNFEAAARDPLAERYDLYPLVEKASGKVIGHCGLSEKEVEGQVEIELVYVLARASWGKGYAAEIAMAITEYAFKQLGVKRLIALIEPENIASKKVAEKVGMHLEKEVIRPGGNTRFVYAIQLPD